MEASAAKNMAEPIAYINWKSEEIIWDGTDGQPEVQISK